MTVAAGLHFMNHQGPRFQIKIFSPTSWSKLTANLHFFCVPYALNCLCEINYKMWRPQSESGCLGVVCVCVWQHCRPSFINGCPLKPHQRLRVCGSIKSAHSAHNIFHHVNFCFVWHCCCNMCACFIFIWKFLWLVACIGFWDFFSRYHNDDRIHNN